MKESMLEMTEGRDAGKTFLVTEMPVSKLEKWCARALVALLGADMAPEITRLARTSSGAALVQALTKGLSGLTWRDAEPLYDELLGYIFVLPGENPHPSQRLPLRPATIDNHIQDLGTIWKLRWTVLGLSLGFSTGGEDSTCRPS